jgi:hypothetical protein
MRDHFFGKLGDPVPVVDALDLEAMWQIGQDIRTRHPGELVGVSAGFYERACQPGADVRALRFRAMMIEMLIRREHQELTLEDDALRAKVFEVASRIPMTWIGFGRIDALPFDTEEFVRKVRSLS